MKKERNLSCEEKKKDLKTQQTSGRPPFGRRDGHLASLEIFPISAGQFKDDEGSWMKMGLWILNISLLSMAGRSLQVKEEEEDEG